VALSIDAQRLEIIREISAVYSLLQNCYSEWASNFSNHEDVIRWLEKENISTDKIRKRIRKQSRFNLHSSHWNGITISLIEKLAARNINELEGHFDSLFRAQSNENRRMIWYLLFFLHPVRHELYYFDNHYPAGYRARQTHKLRSHRSGLKAAKSYLSGKRDAKLGDPFIKGCKTIAFKHLLLFPTTAQWQLPQTDLLSRLKSLDIAQGDLTQDEKIMAILLSQDGSLQFDQWLAYAPCAINEGPIFVAKAGADLHDCFGVILNMLARDDVSQAQLRKCLQEFFEINILI
jgi:hypothetical protein